ncbi:MAG TPA: hypothetical protein PLD10_13165 [Rhodopila sp.]|nr:hypothetical protein [Rhodopila sp.]
MAYIAYLYHRNKEFRSDPNPDRLVAARELLNKFPNKKNVTTCREHNGWPTGSDMRFHTRRELFP